VGTWFSVLIGKLSLDGAMSSLEKCAAASFPVLLLSTTFEIYSTSYFKSAAKQMRMKVTIIAAVPVEQTCRSGASSSGGSTGESTQHPYKRKYRKPW